VKQIIGLVHTELEMKMKMANLLGLMDLLLLMITLTRIIQVIQEEMSFVSLFLTPCPTTMGNGMTITAGVTHIQLRILCVKILCHQKLRQIMENVHMVGPILIKQIDATNYLQRLA